MLEQETCEKNLSQGKEIAKLEATVDRLRYQLRQKNAHEANLRRTHIAEKKEQKTSKENKALKLEKELMRVKSANTESKDATKLENDKLKENLRSLKILHKEQLRLNTARLSDQNSTIKSLQRKISALEKSEAKITTQFAEFQRQSVLNIAKLEHKKELIEIKGVGEKDSENLKRKEMMNEKEK